jgi:nucleoside-diphosphate-sugar epimerase
MRIVITGNLGYVGPVVVRHLRNVLGPSAELIGVDSGFFAHCLTIPSDETLPETALDAQYWRDVREMPISLLRGADAVVHLAAVSNDPMGSRFELVTDAINHRASVDLAHLAAKAGVKTFVFASSCSVYGFAEDGRPRTETDTLNPLTAYARSKIATEQSLRQADLGDMQVRCLRFATACGMSPRLRLDLVLNDFVACALASHEITVLSDGSPWRPLIDVRDMARAVEWAITASQQAGVFVSVNVGSDEWNYQVRSLATAVADAVPGTKVSINTNAPPDRRSYRVDFSQWRRLAPLHQPRITLSESINALRDGLSAFGFADTEFRDSWMIRLKVLDSLMGAGQVDASLHQRNRTRGLVIPDLLMIAEGASL